jgi:hypothetical protein
MVDIVRTFDLYEVLKLDPLIAGILTQEWRS